MPPTLTSRYLAAFNRIDSAMRKTTGLTDQSKYSFSAVLRRYCETCYFEESNFLNLVTELRNFIVHNQLDPNVEFTVPAPNIITRLERIANSIDAPENVEKFISSAGVTTISPESSIKSVFDLIQEKQFSQFPVWVDDQITGLLTENGISRWLCSLIVKESILDFDEVKVSEVLAHEEERENMILIARISIVSQVRMRFIQNPLLEAAIITQAGRADQPPLGIITRWDFI